MKKQPPVSKYDRLSYLLGAYGSGSMTEQQFWGQMNQSGYGQDDIDQWCAEYHSKHEVAS
jgi:hypothetical protein